MDKTALKQITTLLPFDAKYIKVGRGKKNIKWNLMDSDGNLISTTWFSSIIKNTDGSIVTALAKRKELELAKGISEQEKYRLDVEKETKIGVAKALAEGIKTMQLPRIVNLGTGTTPGASDVGESIKTFLDVKTLNALDSVK